MKEWERLVLARIRISHMMHGLLLRVLFLPSKSGFGPKGQSPPRPNKGGIHFELFHPSLINLGDFFGGLIGKRGGGGQLASFFKPFHG